MRALFINLGMNACGVSEFGRRLFHILLPSDRVEWCYHEPASAAECSMPGYDVVVYNWIDGQGGFLAGAPFLEVKSKQVLVYHDGHCATGFDAVLFADPDKPAEGKWHPFGRPIPDRCYSLGKGTRTPVIGVHGFRGAQADWVVEQVLKEFEHAAVRLLLPFSHYCDPSGAEARGMADDCARMVAGTGVGLEVRHELLREDKLLEWLSDNDINCYMRDPAHNWAGVSSAPDCALAVRRPIAVNKCNAFRHLHHCDPSICVEDSSLRTIMRHGVQPLLPLYERWAQHNVRAQVDDIILALQGQ